jgi:hypothetical protein
MQASLPDLSAQVHLLAAEARARSQGKQLRSACVVYRLRDKSWSWHPVAGDNSFFSARRVYDVCACIHNHLHPLYFTMWLRFLNVIVYPLSLPSSQTIPVA